jgi:hypothetical protein
MAYERHPAELQALVVKALVEAGCVADPWGTKVLHRVSKATRVSHVGAPNFIEDLEARGIVRIEWAPVSVGASGMKPLRLRRWVACE